MWPKRKIMINKEQINIDNIQALMGSSGLDLFVTALMQQTRSGQDQLKITTVDQTRSILIDQQSGLDRFLSEMEFFMRKITHTVAPVRGNFDAWQLLGNPRFMQACASEVDLNQDLAGNQFLTQVVGLPAGTIPVFYGSTAGINLAELLETSLSAKFLKQKGINCEVVFDFEAIESRESQAIFDQSMKALPLSLREKALNFSQGFSRRIDGRLAATEDLLARMDGLPKVNLVDGVTLFDKLRDNFTLGQLLLMARIAGNNPKLFEGTRRSVSLVDFLSDNLPTQLQSKSIMDLLKIPVSKVMDNGFKPAGFTYYAREARIARFTGVCGYIFKLTDKANIYKILLDCGCLFDPVQRQGAILLPVTRQRIQIGDGLVKPIDPIALKFLSEDQPETFQALVRDFQKTSQVLTPAQVRMADLNSRNFMADSYFNLEGTNE